MGHTAVVPARQATRLELNQAHLVAASVAGVVISGVDAFSLEAAASLLIAAFALKLIEMKSRRDAHVVIFLGYFAIATQFLFDQTIMLAFYQLLALIVVTAAGGARMQEGILSLMQMPRTTIAVQMTREAGLPYIVVLTDPTTGGVTASYAMLGDITIAAPALAKPSPAALSAGNSFKGSSVSIPVRSRIV